MLDPLMADILTAQIKASQAISNQVEENTQQDAIRARLAVVDMLDGMWSASEKSDSLALYRLADYKESLYGRYREPFYFEKDEYHEMVKKYS